MEISGTNIECETISGEKTSFNDVKIKSFQEKASLGSEVLPVETEGEYIGKDSKIVVTGKFGNIIRVKRV